MSALWNGIVRSQTGKGKDEDHCAVGDSIDEYVDMYAEDTSSLGHDSSKIKERKTNYTSLVNNYYDLVTDFYEYGWGQSFHFAPRFKGETFAASLARHEHLIAVKLQVKPGDRVVDAGCGVGGPMRSFARFTGARVTGINNNDYQIKRSNHLNRKTGLDHLCETVKGNFHALPYEPETFDHAYAIEALCHSPELVKVYSEMFRVLKPGGRLVSYEWCMTDLYDPDNAAHRAVKHGIEKGDGLPDLQNPKQVVQALRDAGFEVEEHYDAAAEAAKGGNDIEWYSTLQGSVCSPSQFKHSHVGRFVTQRMVNFLEMVGVAPAGTGKTHEMLSGAANNLAKGGEWGIFTPMYLVVARKPL